MMEDIRISDIRPKLNQMNKTLDDNSKSGLGVMNLLSEHDVFWLMEALEVALDSFDRMEEAYRDVRRQNADQ